MAVEGVMITYNYSEESEQAKIITVSSSGIKFSDRWVLAHGSLLSPLKESKVIENTIGKATMNEEFYSKLPEVHITCEKKPSETNLYEKVEKMSKDRDIMQGLDLGHSSYQIKVLAGRICHVWQCPVISACVEEIIFGWTIGYKDGEYTNQTDIGKTMLPIFVLIDLGSDNKDYKTLRPLSSLLDIVRPPPNRGTTVEIHSTPFGCEAFLNTVTKGWISRVVGHRPSLLLTDATTALGSEGAPVFSGPDNELVAMVVCSLSWWRGEWVGLTMLAPLATVLATKLHVTPPTMHLPAAINPHSALIESIDRVMVQVRCGSSCGAGLYVGRGYILTCAHVVRNYALHRVSVFARGRREAAIVRYKSIDDRAYDLALLFTNPHHWTNLTPANIAKDPAVIGEPVLAAGFPYYAADNIEELLPTITTGHINNVSPTLVQTSCCVQSGFSGGPVLRITDGQQVEALGIITCNAKTDSGAMHPRVNMSVPLVGFDQILHQYLQDKDLSRLDVMNIDKEIVQSQWRLEPYRSKI